jgi:hypothetical protein
MIDLEQVAEANAPNIDLDFGKLLSVRTISDRAKILQFSEWVRDFCKITINSKLFVIFDLLNNGKYLNIYDAASNYSHLFHEPQERFLRAWLGAFYERRIAFDKAFKDGEKFIYGALTAGDGGLREYDPYCLQLVDHLHASAKALAYLPGDSVAICFSPSGDFDEAGTCAMITPHSHRHVSAAANNWQAVLLTNNADWPNLLNQKTNYIEAIFVDDLTLDKIEKVQVLKSEYDRMISLVLRTVGRKVESAEHTLIYCFCKILSAAKDGTIELEAVL